MAKRKKKARSGRKKKAAPQNLPALGEKQLKKLQFSEAIKTFRQLFKNDADQGWLLSLSYAYRGRISQLTTKGMAKEALVIYTNMVNSCGVDDHRLHVRLLLSCGMYEQAFEIYSILTKTLSKDGCHAIEEVFAAALLSGTGNTLTFLPDDSLIKQHYLHADQALSCYCQADFTGARSHLRNISFRSPYRNFRLAMNGILIFAENRREALNCMNKIDENSVFYHWCAAYRQLGESAVSMDNLSRLEKQVGQILTGIDKEKQVFIDAIGKLQDKPVRLYSFLINKGRFLQREMLQRLCLQILPHASEKFIDYQNRFGNFSEIEFVKINALIGEVEHQYWHAADDWQSVMEILEKSNNPADNLKIATICRYSAELLLSERDTSNNKEIISLLEKSLEYDPHDRDTYFVLLSLNGNSSAKCYRIVNRALAEFPEDIEVLFIAIEAAIGRGAFKKASRIAAKLLEIDPINNKARLLLIAAHLNHGRKLAGNGKFNLAFKESEAASAYDRANLAEGEIEIFHGLSLLLSGDKENGFKLHDEGVKRAGSPVLGSFQACFEARLLAMPVKWQRVFDKNFRLVLKTVPDKKTFIALVNKIQRCNGKNMGQLEKVKKIASAWLKKGANLDLSRDDFLFVSSVFYNHNFFDLLQLYGKKMEKLWPDMPLGTFYHLYGLSKNGSKRFSISQLDQLSIAMQTAVEQNDPKTHRLIDDLLARQFGPVSNFGGGIGSLAGKSIEQLAEMLGRGDIDHDDFLKFCEENGCVDEIISEMDQIFGCTEDDFEDDFDDDEIFKIPPQSSSAGAQKNSPSEKKETKNNPKQLDLFE